MICSKELFALIRFCVTIATPIVYIVSFASSEWIKNDTQELGLWKWCYTNFTDMDDAEDHVRDTMRCHAISAGESKGYFEAARVWSCFTLINYILLFFTFKNNQNYQEAIKPVIIGAFAVSNAGVTLTLIGTGYKDDVTFLADSGPILGWCYWLAVAAAFLVGLSIILNGVNAHQAKSSPPPKNATSPKKPAPTPAPPKPATTAQTTSSSGASNIFISLTPGTTTTTTTTKKTTMTETSTTSTTTTTATIHRVDQANEAGGSSAWGAEKPVLRSSRSVGTEGRIAVSELPAYNIPSEPSNVPSIPPPAYVDVVGEGEGFTTDIPNIRHA